jgi:hypothetical protein
MMLQDGHYMTAIDPRWLHRPFGRVAHKSIVLQVMIRVNIPAKNRDASEAKCYRQETMEIRQIHRASPRGFEKLAETTVTLLYWIITGHYDESEVDDGRKNH